jgi:hypothetical protein
MSFCEKLCVRLIGNTNSAIFDILPDVCSDLNVTNYEEVSTSEIITLEIRTRGQHENPLWYKVRKGRITASIFHDVLTRKSKVSRTDCWKL